MLIMLKYLNLETIIDDFRNNITKQLNNIEEEDKKQSRFRKRKLCFILIVFK